MALAGLHLYKTWPLYGQTDNPYDGRNVFLAGKIWFKGLNPYNDSLLKAEWKQWASGFTNSSVKEPGFPDCGMIYPFYSIPVLFPYFISGWKIQRILIWLLGILCLTGISILTYIIWNKALYRYPVALILVLAFKSSPAAVALGQPMLLSLFCILASWYFYIKNKEILSGIFLGLGMLKITLCLPLLIFFLALKKWKLLVSASVIPLLGGLIFFFKSGDLYIHSMLENMSTQMYINYAGHAISAVNTNLTEAGILFNYFLNTDSSTLLTLNAIFLPAGFVLAYFLFTRKLMDSSEFLAWLILWNLLFSYHLVYDCLILLFLIPIISNSRLSKTGWILVLSLLFLPVNGIFRDTGWIKFHLPFTLIALFLLLVYHVIQQRQHRNV